MKEISKEERDIIANALNVTQKWTKYELENMIHIDKMISKIHKYVNGYDFQSNDSRMCVVNLIDLFPSMKVGEEINIDEELERNGMHR